jgi:hypothetical protein
MSAISQERFWLVARDKPGLLIHMMRFLAGEARISFEGDLSRCRFPETIPNLAGRDGLLTRSTLEPELDFVILPLEEETIRPLLDVVLPGNRYMQDIIHIQIEKRGELQFGCYDRFHPECIVCFRGVTAKFLDELKRIGILRSWTLPF